MNTKIKIIAVAIGAAMLLFAAYAIGVHSPANAPGLSQMPAASTDINGTSTTGTVPVIREFSAVLPSSSSAATSLPVNGSLDPAVASPAGTYAASRTTTTTESSPQIAYRAAVVRRVRHEAPGNIHVSRALKHVVGFTAEFPFRLRP